MSRRSSQNEYRRSQWLIAAVYLALIGALTLASASADDSVRSSVTKQYRQSDGAGAQIAETQDVYATLAANGERVRTRDEAAHASSGRTARASTNDFWIYDADAILFGDDDNDGYFYGIDLLFDADTVFSSVPVYAVLYLSLDGGPWNEYAVTEDFLIEGATSADEYVVVTELQSGYPTGSYDLLIELFDADTGEFLTDLGPEASPALSLLTLEDFNRDAPAFDTRVTVSRGGGGGSATFWTLAALLGVVLINRARRRRVAVEPRA